MKFSMIILICGIVISHAAVAKVGNKLAFYLNDGRIIEGVFLRIDGFLIRINTEDGEKVFLKSSISRIERAGKIVTLYDLLGKSMENKKDASYLHLPANADQSANNGLDKRMHTLSIGVGIGYALSITSEAIKDFPYTSFEGSMLYAGSLILLLPGNIGSSNTPAQIGFEIAASKYSMELIEEGSDFGRLSLLSTMFLLKFIQYPRNLIGPGFHIEVGGGVFFSSFHKGPFVSLVERETGTLWQIRNTNSPFFELGCGLDLFLGASSSFSINARLFLGNIDTKWTACTQDVCETLQDFDKFSASSMEISGALRFWF